MPMYRERTTGEIKGHLEWKKHFKNSSIPQVWTTATLDALNLDEVLSSTQPDVTVFQVAQLDGAVQNSDGDWVENWIIVDQFSDITDEDGNVVQTKDEREAEYTENQNRANEEQNKRKRDSLLKDTDWTQIPDSPLSDESKTAWATYRQALRDITTHASWPNLADEDWPSEPV